VTQPIKANWIGTDKSNEWGGGKRDQHRYQGKIMWGSYK